MTSLEVLEEVDLGNWLSTTLLGGGAVEQRHLAGQGGNGGSSGHTQWSYYTADAGGTGGTGNGGDLVSNNSYNPYDSRAGYGGHTELVSMVIYASGNLTVASVVKFQLRKI